MEKNIRGFTLVEMMIVVVVGAILVAIALPAYQNQVRKAKRSDAMDALMTIQQQQERFRANNSSYATSITGTGTGLGLSTASLEGYYALSVTGPTGSGSPSSTGFRVTATAVAGTSQASDTGCTPMWITVDSSNPRGVKEPDACW